MFAREFHGFTSQNHKCLGSIDDYTYASDWGLFCDTSNCADLERCLVTHMQGSHCSLTTEKHAPYWASTLSLYMGSPSLITRSEAAREAGSKAFSWASTSSKLQTRGWYYLKEQTHPEGTPDMLPRDQGLGLNPESLPKILPTLRKGTSILAMARRAVGGLFQFPFGFPWDVNQKGDPNPILRNMAGTRPDRPPGTTQCPASAQRGGGK